MMNQQTILFIYSVVSVNRNIVGYNKYLPVITVVVVSVIVVVIAIFVRIFYSRPCSSSSTLCISIYRTTFTRTQSVAL